jgi:hypothetical protein
MSTARNVSRWAATVIAAVGWLAGLWVYLAEGFAAGVHPGFIAALSVAISFTVVASQCWALPHRAAREEQASIYALGYAEGLSCGACPIRPVPEGGDRVQRLEVVR